MIRKIFKDKSFIKNMMMLAIPISIQSMIQSSLGIIDQVMVGQLGQNAVAGVGLGGRIPFIFFMVIAGITSGTSIYVSQYWGKKDTNNIKQVMGATLMIGTLVAILFMSLALLMPKGVVALFSRDQAVIQEGASYLAIVSLSFVPVLITMTYSSVLRSTHHVKLTLYAGLMSVVTNTILNYILIFGYLGMPVMGVKGAAIATTVSKVIEALVIVAVVYGKKLPGCVRIKDLVTFKMNFFKLFMITTLPLLINEFLWSAGESIYTGIYGFMGTEQATSMIITYPLQSFCISIFIGLSSAAGVMIGNKLGENKYDIAYDYAKNFTILGILGAVIVGIGVMLISDIYVSTYKISHEVQNNAIILIIVFCCVLCVKVGNMIMGGGVLRSGGQTKLTLFLDILGTWGIGIPIGLLAAFVLKLPLYAVYLLISLEEVVRFIIGLIWMKRKIWIKNIINDEI